MSLFGSRRPARPPVAEAGPAAVMQAVRVWTPARTDSFQVRRVPVILVAGNLPGDMATTPERQTIAPLVGPDDPRRFTDSGIEVKPLYDETDLPEGLGERLGEPGAYPY